ncbi:unnamed protein product, partial [Prorocentrum cordatum]
ATLGEAARWLAGAAWGAKVEAEGKAAVVDLMADFGEVVEVPLEDQDQCDASLAADADGTKQFVVKKSVEQLSVEERLIEIKNLMMQVWTHVLQQKGGVAESQVVLPTVPRFPLFGSHGKDEEACASLLGQPLGFVPSLGKHAREDDASLAVGADGAKGQVVDHGMRDEDPHGKDGAGHVGLLVKPPGVVPSPCRDAGRGYESLAVDAGGASEPSAGHGAQDELVESGHDEADHEGLLVKPPGVVGSTRTEQFADDVVKGQKEDVDKDDESLPADAAGTTEPFAGDAVQDELVDKQLGEVGDGLLVDADGAKGRWDACVLGLPPDEAEAKRQRLAAILANAMAGSS